MSDVALSSKPIVLTVGNCQARFIADFAAGLPELHDRFTFKSFRSFGDTIPDADTYGEAPIGLRDFIHREGPRIHAVLLQQSHDWKEIAFEPHELLPHARAVKVPVALLSCLWPFAFEDPRKNSPSSWRYFPASMCNSLLATLIKRGATLQTIYDDYMGADIHRLVNLDRLYKHNKAKMEQIDQLSDFSGWRYIESNLSSARTFRLTNHPSGNFMAYLLENAMRRLFDITDEINFKHHLDAIANGPGIQPIEAAIHPEVRRHFNIKWDSDRYITWDLGAISQRKYLEGLFLLKWDDRVEIAQSLFENNEPDGALNLIEEFIADAPDNHIGYRTKGTFLLGLARFREAASCLTHAFELEPSVVAGNLVIRCFISGEMIANAVRFLRRWADRLGSGSVEYQLARYDVFGADRQPKQALKVLRQLVAGNCQDPVPWLLLGRKEMEKNNFGEAKRCFERTRYLSAGTRYGEYALAELEKMQQVYS